MKRYIGLGLFGLGLMVSPVLGGIVHAAVPANPKIGVVNFQETLMSTPAGKRANEAFENGRKAKQATLDKQQDDLRKADTELKKQQGVITPAAFEQRRGELEKKYMELQTTYAKLQGELAQDRAKLIQDFSKAAEPKLAAIAKAEGVTVVFDKSATVWMDSAVDLTAKLNAEMK